MYRIVKTFTNGDIIIVSNNGKYEMYGGKKLADYVGTIPSSELKNLDEPNDTEIQKIIARHLVG